VNLLGASPLNGFDNQALAFFDHALAQAGFETGAVWGMRSSFVELGVTPSATANLVLSASALPLAEYLRGRFNTPFTAMLPLGLDGAARLRSALAAFASGQEPAAWEETGPAPCGSGTTLAIAEPLMAAEIRRLSGAEAYSFFGTTDALSMEGVTHIPTEEAAEKLLAGGDINALTADPLAAGLLPKGSGVEFLPLPHRAVSGRLYSFSIAETFGEQGEAFFAALLGGRE
jgi:hypothetical protein